jgi:hypothetical protein
MCFLLFKRFSLCSVSDLLSANAKTIAMNARQLHRVQMFERRSAARVPAFFAREPDAARVKIRAGVGQTVAMGT